jgi:hypothetical protein
MAMKGRLPTTIRFTDDDRAVIEKLEELTGLQGATAVIRMSLRESLRDREARWPRAAKKVR